MRADFASVTRGAARQLVGTRAALLPPQRTLWGRVRAALAFQPAYPLPLRVAADPDSGPSGVPTPYDHARAEFRREVLDSRRDVSPELREAVAALPPAKRLAVRGDPQIAKIVRSTKTSDTLTHAVGRMSLIIAALDQPLDLARALNLAGSLTRVLDLALSFARDRALDRASALAGAVDFLLDRAPAPDLPHDVVALRLTQTLVGDLDRVLGLARVSVRAFDNEPEDDLALARTFARAPDRSGIRALVLDLTQARDRAHDLAYGFDLGRALDGASLINLHRARSLVRDLARSSMDIVAILHQSACDTAGDHERTVAKLLGLGQSPSHGLGWIILDGALDDFTTADLSTADLRVAFLQGMYWSVWGTRWPRVFDIEQLKSVSREVDPGTGVYRVERNAPSIERVSVMVG